MERITTGQYGFEGKVLPSKPTRKKSAILTADRPHAAEPPLASSDLFTEAQTREIDEEIRKKFPALRIVSMGRVDKDSKGHVEVRIRNRLGKMSRAVLLQDAIVSVNWIRGNRRYVRFLTTEAAVSVLLDGETEPYTVFAGERLETKAKMKKINPGKIPDGVMPRLRMPYYFSYFRK